MRTRGRSLLLGIALMGACSQESASPPEATSGIAPTVSTAPNATTVAVTSTATTVAATVDAAPPAEVDVDVVVENGTFLGFLSALDTAAGSTTVTYDRIEVGEISWLPGVLEMDAMANENAKQRRVPVATDASVTVWCGGPLGIDSSGCATGEPVAGSLRQLQDYLGLQPYSWTAARAGIRTSEPYPAVFELRVEGGVVTAIIQRTAMPESVAGWNPDLGPWMRPAIEPCCREPGFGNVSEPFPEPGTPLPPTLYAAEAYEAGWSPDRTNELTLTLYRWVPNACIAEGWCDEGAVEIDRSSSMPYTVTLDSEVAVHVMSHKCTSTVGRPEAYVGDGNSFAQLLADLRADTEQWLAAPVRAGTPLATALRATGSPFEPEPCLTAETGVAEGEAIYHHESGIEVLLQTLPMSTAGELRSPTVVVPVYSLGVDDNDVIHLFSSVGFRS